MTNADKLKVLFDDSDYDEIAKELCHTFDSCRKCPMVMRCKIGLNGWWDWLTDEAEADDS